MKKGLPISIIIVIFFAVCFGCENQPTEENTKALDTKALGVYETLIDATDAEVVAVLGEGKAENAPATTSEDGTTYDVLWQRTYIGCPFRTEGNTVVRFFLPDWKDVTSGAYQEDPPKVSCVIFSALLVDEETQPLMNEFFEALDTPVKESAAFNSQENYNCVWEKESCDYWLWYSPPTQENDSKANITLSILDKTFNPLSRDAAVETMEP